MSKRLVAHSKCQKLVIEEDVVGWYLYVYDFSGSQCLKDFLLDSLNEAQEEARELYGINTEDWKIESTDK